jgi:hypothetical protein
MTYADLVTKLQALEQITGVELSDICVDAENAGSNPTDYMLYDCAFCAALDRADEAGLDLYALLKTV